MNALQAYAEIERRTDATSAPVLEVADLESLLSSWLVSGTEGLGIWNLNRAAASGWRIKAGRIVDRINYAADGRTFDASQFFDHCLKMADMWDQAAGANDEGITPPVDSMLRTRSVRNAPVW